MFRKFNFDTEWAVKLISRITDGEDMPIEGGAIVKQVLMFQYCFSLISCAFLMINDIHLCSFWHFKLMLRSTTMASERTW